jgi:hypothetical protein
MALLKMLKAPTKPKLPKKPKEGATFASKTAYLRKIKDISEKYAAKVKATNVENAKRTRINEESKKLSKVIAGINGVEVLSKGFSVRKVRMPRPGAKVSGTRKKTTAKRKTVAKRKTTTKRRK